MVARTVEKTASVPKEFQMFETGMPKTSGDREPAVAKTARKEPTEQPLSNFVKRDRHVVSASGIPKLHANDNRVIYHLKQSNCDVNEKDKGNTPMMTRPMPVSNNHLCGRFLGINLIDTYAIAPSTPIIDIHMLALPNVSSNFCCNNGIATVSSIAIAPRSTKFTEIHAINAYISGVRGKWFSIAL